MSDKKGFTLIELLGVIVILALIAFIATPIVLNIIKDTNSKSNMISIKNYAKAIELSLSDYMLSNSSLPSGIYSIQENGKIINGNIDLNIDYSGISIKNGKVIIGKDGSIAIVDSSIDSNDKKYNYVLNSSGDGLYNDKYIDNRLVYKGSNPNNYIWLDENGDTIKDTMEIYRVISYEPDGTIKVVRNSIGSMTFDDTNYRNSTNNNSYCDSEYGCNAWGNQQTTYLNDEQLNNYYYEYYHDDTSVEMINTEKGGVSIISTLNDYLNNTWYTSLSGINRIIEKHLFNVGGHYGNGLYINFKKENEEETLLQWKGNVGLISVTDYINSSLNSSCTNIYTSKIKTNEKFECAELNWLNNNTKYFTISPYLPSKCLEFMIFRDGNVSYDNTTVPADIRPVFYLKSGIGLSGSGTNDNPYVIISN